MTTSVAFVDVNFNYTSSQPILCNVSMEVPANGYVCVVGKSGSGKTTLLRLVAGLETPVSGEVRLHTANGHQPSVQMVFQDYSRSLLPWLTVGANVALALSREILSPNRRQDRVAEMLTAVGLSGLEDRFPRELSGGMQQRVALARALASKPSVLLLDEPFGALDTPTKLDLQEEMLRLKGLMGFTVMHVTHDLDEACFLADSIIVTNMGRTTETIENTLAHPRRRLESRESPDFLHLRRRLFEKLGYV